MRRLRTPYHHFKQWQKYRREVGKPLHVKVIDGPGVPIVFLHGIASNMAVWDKVIEPLRGKRKIVLVDLLGFGASPKPEPYDYTAGEHVYAVHKALRKSGIKGRVFVVGHSMGAIIAARYGATYRSKVLGLVLCSLPIYKRSELSDQKLRIWQRETDNIYFKAYEMLRGRKDWALKAANVLQRLGVRQVELGEESWYAFEQSLKNTVEHQQVSRDIKKQNIPVEIIYGSLDPLIITKHLSTLARLHNVTLHRLRTRHDLTDSFSAKIAEQILKTTRQ